VSLLSDDAAEVGGQTGSLVGGEDPPRAIAAPVENMVRNNDDSPNDHTYALHDINSDLAVGTNIIVTGGRVSGLRRKLGEPKGLWASVRSFCNDLDEPDVAGSDLGPHERSWL